MTDDEKPQFVQSFNRLCVALREKDPDVIQMRVYFEGLKDLELQLVTAAADHLSLSAEWFPKLPEWRAAVEQIRLERHDAQRAFLRSAKRPLCPVCEDTGWEPMSIVEHGQPVRRVRICGCREQRKRELLGLSPAPALPPVEREPDLTQEPRALKLVERAVKGF